MQNDSRKDLAELQEQHDRRVLRNVRDRRVQRFVRAVTEHDNGSRAAGRFDSHEPWLQQRVTEQLQKKKKNKK